MNAEEAIPISSDSEEYVNRRAILDPVVRRVVDALGGHEGGTYRLGDAVSGCLKDLKKLWRKDDTDDERTVARIFWETRVLPNDLVPILLATAGKGLVEDKRAIACADLMAAMTWPIDMAEELRELDDELDQGADYTQLLLSHLHYKAALLMKPGVMQALFGMALPPLAKKPKERTARDGQVVMLVLYIIRNLAFIKDLPPNTHLSADQAEYSSLQTKLIVALSETHTLDLLLTISANTANDPLFSSLNTIALEIFYLIFRGTKPSSLVIDQVKQPAENLHNLLAAEGRARRDFARSAPSRHSRFGTTISVKLNPKKFRPNSNDTGDGPVSEPVAASDSFVLHRQQAITRDAGGIMDLAKQQRSKKGTKLDELTHEDNLSLEARLALQTLAKEFVRACFNSFVSSLLKDIKSERPKITEKDNLRLLYLTKWFLEFFLCLRNKESAESKWSFGLIAEVIERGWIVWVLKRIRQASEEKPKFWTELQAGIECLTQLLLLIDSMSTSDMSDPTLAEAAEILQQQLVYNGEVLDIAFESLRSYKEGTQSLTYLDSGVHLAYALLRMLERWGRRKGGEMYVRTKKTKRKKRSRGADAQEGDAENMDEEEASEPEDVIHETMFTFEAFEMKFAHPDITHTLLEYLARYKTFNSSEPMRRVVGLLHRQAIRAKAEGLFFKVSTLDLFKTILADLQSLPREQPYKDLVQLINFILRRFFKALAEEPFLAVEAFFPKNRGQWKHFSSWEPEEKGRRRDKPIQTSGDVRIKKGHSWSEQIGIAIAVLVENNKLDLVNWTRDILGVVIHKRQRIIDETDQRDEEDTPEDDGDELPKTKKPSSEALARMTDYPIPYINDQQVTAARDPQLKLLFRLAKFALRDEGDDDEPEWYIPAGIPPSELQSILVVIDQFLEKPFDLDGKKASEFLNKSRRRRRRRSPSTGSDLPSDEDEPSKSRKEKKKKEKEQYKSAVFIEDSDAEYGEIEAFLEKEKALRERTARIAAETGVAGTMKPTGTKKRRKKPDAGIGKKRKGNDEMALVSSDREQDGHTHPSGGNDIEVLDGSSSTAGSNPPAKERPRPRPTLPASHSPMASDSPSELLVGVSNAGNGLGESAADVTLVDSDPEGSPRLRSMGKTRRKIPLFISDDEE